MDVRLIVAALLLTTACDDEPSVPRTSLWEIDHSPGMSPYLSIGNTFEFPQMEGSVHYVTRPTGPLRLNQCVVMRYNIEAAPDVTFHPTRWPAMPTTLVLYFQRRGDNLSADGKYETYRWWFTPRPNPVQAGEQELRACFNENWTAVETSSAETKPVEFREALANAERIGFTFGGGDGYGHGVYASGPAKFTLLDFQVTG